VVKMIHCDKCGAKIDEDSTFCPDCGAKVKYKEEKEETKEEIKNTSKYFKTSKDWDFKFYFKKCFIDVKTAKKNKDIPIKYLHSTILKNKEVNYTKDEREAVEKVDSGEFAVAVILKPMDIKDLEFVVKKKILLPQKSTYFYPKVSTGVVFNELD